MFDSIRDVDEEAQYVDIAEPGAVGVGFYEIDDGLYFGTVRVGVDAGGPCNCYRFESLVERA